MVRHLPVMMIAVVIAMGIITLLCEALTDFVCKHPIVVVLCLGFLARIGFSPMIEGFGFAIPNGYLHAAIGVSVRISRTTRDQ